MDHALRFAKNPRMTRIALAIGTAVLLTGRTDGQEMRFFYPAPQPSQIHVTRNVPYGQLQMDVYRPATAREVRLPALVIFPVAAGEQSRADGAGVARAD
jgi:hypothetical protein